MDNASGGAVVWKLDLDDRNFSRKLRKSSSEVNDFGSNTEKGGSRVTQVLGKVVKAATAAAIVIGTTLAVAGVKAAKASWDQVAAVEQATVGLRAYERDGKKVNQVLGDLIKYARSDMGVLFNRKDLFQSAQMLKLNGVRTADLSKNVQILSRSVGLGLGNWQDLNAVVGRVVATGRLSGIEFDQLTQYGFKLDKSLRNVNISATDLFKALDKGIPVDAMEGQANTIRGIGIRLETAFRGIGDAILGVDADTSKFIKGGLGDRLVKGVGTATQVLKRLQPAIAATSKAFIAGAVSLGKSLTPEINSLGRTIRDKLFPAFSGIGKSEFARQIGTTMVVAVKILIQAVDMAVGSISNLVTMITRAGPIILGAAAGIAVYKIGMLGAAAATNIVEIATKAHTAAQWALNVAMKANPVGLLTSVVVGLGVALWSATRASDGTSGASRRLKVAHDELRAATDAAKAAQDRLKDALLTQEGAALNVERAQRNYTQAVREYGPKSLEAREAAYALKRANDDLAKSNKAVADETREATKAEQEKAKKAREIVEINRQIAASANATARSYLSWSNAAKKAKDEEIKSGKGKGGARPGFSNEALGLGKSIGGRAAGGPVRANQPYFVGDNPDGSLNDTSELFVPKTSGHIMNSKDLQSALRTGGSTAHSVTVNVNLSGIMSRSVADERDIAKGLVERINEELRAKQLPEIGGGALRGAAV